MSRIRFRLPSEIDDPEVRGWVEASIRDGRPGPEIQAIRAQAPGVIASFTKTREWLFKGGILDHDLKELLRAYVATSASCTYCVEYGRSKEWQQNPDEMASLLDYANSDAYSHREKLALRYADAIMWDPALADDELWGLLLAEFTEPEVVELGYWIGFTFGGQRWIKTLGTKQGELDEALRAAAGDRAPGGSGR